MDIGGMIKTRYNCLTETVGTVLVFLGVTVGFARRLVLVVARGSVLLKGDIVSHAIAIDLKAGCECSDIMNAKNWASFLYRYRPQFFSYRQHPQFFLLPLSNPNSPLTVITLDCVTNAAGKVKDSHSASVKPTAPSST